MTGVEGRIALLLTLMRQLQETMRIENGLLRELGLARMRELQSEKAALAERYEIELRRLRQTPEALGARPVLRRHTTRWQAAVEPHSTRWC